MSAHPLPLYTRPQIPGYTGIYKQHEEFTAEYCYYKTTHSALLYELQRLL